MSKIESIVKLVLVTGVSGAGHSTALKILEDYGFAAVDNLPLALVDPLIALEVETGGRSIAMGLMLGPVVLRQMLLPDWFITLPDALVTASKCSLSVLIMLI